MQNESIKRTGIMLNITDEIWIGTKYTHKESWFVFPF